MSRDPVAERLVASVARPGGNITGVRLPLAEQAAKRLQLMKEVVPGLDSVAVVANMAGMGPDQDSLKSVEAAARTLGISTHVFDLRGQKDVDAVVAAAVAKRVRGLIVLQDPVLFRAGPKLAEAAARHRLPASHVYREFADAGGLFSYGHSLWDIYLLAVSYIDRVLKGAKPGGLPMEQPTKFELVINLKTAKALGLTIPPSLLLRADQVIE
jgi:putative ABC transport system substrate-binding protein